MARPNIPEATLSPTSIINRTVAACAAGLLVLSIFSKEPAPAIPVTAPVPSEASAVEGLLTVGCLDSISVITVPPEGGFYLGDQSLHGSDHTDAFWVKNTQGAIIHGHTADDEGVVKQLDGGFEYDENGDAYRVYYTNYANSQAGVIAVRLEVECAKNPPIDPGFVVRS